jgi:hypothetical protein
MFPDGNNIGYGSRITETAIDHCNSIVKVNDLKEVRVWQAKSERRIGNEDRGKTIKERGARISPRISILDLRS